MLKFFSRANHVCWRFYILFLPQLLNHGEDVDRVKRAAALELSELQQKHQQEVASLKVKGQRRESELTDALARMQGELISVSGGMEALRHEYGALRKQCEGLPGYIKDNVQQTMKEVKTRRE